MLLLAGVDEGPHDLVAGSVDWFDVDGSNTLRLVDLSETRHREPINVLDGLELATSERLLWLAEAQRIIWLATPDSGRGQGCGRNHQSYPTTGLPIC